MKLESFWTDTARPFEDRTDPLPGRVDVAVVGGGFTGLSAARSLARRGARVVVQQPALCKTLIEAPARGTRSLNFWTSKGRTSAPS